MNYAAITIAACDSLDSAKKTADIVCTGKNDEKTINEALKAVENTSAKVYFRNGTYNIDSLSGCDFPSAGLGGICIYAPNSHRTLTLEGENQTWFTDFPSYGIGEGVIFNITEKAFEGINNDVSVSGIIAFPGSDGAEKYPGKCIIIKNIAVRFPTNQRPNISGVNLIYVSGMELSHVFVTTADDFDKMKLPAENTYGIIGPYGSKICQYRLEMSIVRGFERGFDLPGEHIVADGCYALYCKYPFYLARSGSYVYHTNVFIKCGHEDCLYGPYIDDGAREGSLYEFIAYDSEFSEGALFSQRGGAIEKRPGFSRGHVTHCATKECVGITSYPFWEKGSGENFVTWQSTDKPKESQSIDVNATPWLNEIHRGIITENIRENTLSAFKLTGEQGYKYLECDLRETKDKIAVMSHDDTIKDITGREFTISELTYEELKNYPLTHAGDTVPTFEDALKTVYPYGITVNAEMKTNTEEFIEKAVNTVLKCGMSGRVVYNLNINDTKAANAVCKTDKRARFLYSYSPDTIMNYQDMFEDKTRIWIVIPDYKVNEEAAADIRKSGHMFMIYNVNDTKYFEYRPDIIEYRTDLGVDVKLLIREYLKG